MEADPSKTIASPANGAAGKTAKAATGGAFTTMVREVELVRLSSSRTVRVTVYDPETAYAWTVATPESVLPSPKFHPYVAIVPSTSEDPEASNVTLVPGETRLALSANDASGGYTGFT